MWTNPAVQKTLSLLLLIGIGVLLRSKIKNKESLAGVKVLILSVALPATIFVALLKIEIESHLLFLPLLALGFNLVMLLVTYQILPLIGLDKSSPTAKTLMMLLPSLAPGLSCFPFLIEYLGDESLALAALADVGNKVFVLILLYLLAMHWYYQKATNKVSSNGKLKDLLLSLAKEPVNLMIISALVLLGLGLNLKTLPDFLQSTALRSSAMMTPLVLMFIGMAVKIKWEQLKLIFSLLAFRSGFALLLSAIFVSLVPPMAPAIVLLAVVFPQSACSFWPYAHMAAIELMENKDEQSKSKTFDNEFALAILACSLPFSIILILIVCSVGSVFTKPYVLFLCAGIMILIAILPQLLGTFNLKLKTVASREEA
ncbi:MAG: permease [Bacteroidia bacterium]